MKELLRAFSLCCGSTAAGDVHLHTAVSRAAISAAQVRTEDFEVLIRLKMTLLHQEGRSSIQICSFPMSCMCMHMQAALDYCLSQKWSLCPASKHADVSQLHRAVLVADTLADTRRKHCIRACEADT